MHVGVALPNTHEALAEPATMVTVGRLAEHVGFDSLWVNDHIVIPAEPGPSGTGDQQPQYLDRWRQNILEPLVLLAYLAAETERVFLGTSVYVLALRNPLVAAKQVATLDQVSGGRVILGVGVGWMEAEYNALGVPWRERGSRTDEGLRILKTLWGCDHPSIHGRHHDFAEVQFLPKPVQQPHPPLWIGGRSQASVRRAVELGDAWHPSHFTFEEFRQWVPRLRERCERTGRAPDSVQLTTRRRLMPECRSSDPPEKRRVLQGSAAEVADDVRQLAVLGVAHLVIEFEATTQSQLLETVEWAGREVLPLMR